MEIKYSRVNCMPDRMGHTTLSKVFFNCKMRFPGSLKLPAFLLLLTCNLCYGQKWMGEVTAGVSQYNGDLTQQAVSFKRIKPAVGFGVKYNSGDLLDISIGLMFARVGADDKDNKRADYQARNLSFKTNILELNVRGEFNLVDPEVYLQIPYVFAGLGVFHFNPFTDDNEGNKTYLRPLSTEGEGLAEYPKRKEYSLYQFCIPFGAGFKIKTTDKWQLSYEFGYRYLLTDYLDDVSKTYVSLEILNLRKGPKSSELSYRKSTPFIEEGYPRGNSKVRDYYFFTGVKFAFNLTQVKIR
jgi:hypothetical protein